MKKKKEANKLFLIDYGSDFLKTPVVKTSLIVIAAYSTIYLSKYFLNASAGTIRACKNFREACRGN
ncbi:hypothetical protein [Flavivirga eckloniae]|uniref:Uncharacterized protein n=1 Tax=Flavivirga eckloniae TaxID=1803846 RepID=A0A2K9PVW6_9FLAO|nr:hypothetical protein [Flavivirga eckloniae]AUP81225.1 hypothetical protein C1H87_21910 [Flavivirga eckloniae]